jgi:alpha-beta hydrolase superfamily lysophospholipase
MSDMLLHYLDLIDALALDRPPHLIGFSMGGWMAGELAGIARERFAGSFWLLLPDLQIRPFLPPIWPRLPHRTSPLSWRMMPGRA